MFQFWLGFGGFLMLAEFILPGLVVVFVGLGAMTVALLLHLSYIESLPEQIITWFVCSIIYTFTLRLVVVRFYPSDREKHNVDEDDQMCGQRVKVVETISAGNSGRIYHGDTTWKARSQSGDEILKGEEVKVVRRDNITWIVERVPTEVPTEQVPAKES